MLAAAGAVTAIELAVASRYGFHRDELYFIAAGQHLDTAYVDQPPFVAVVARLAGELWGAGSLTGLRAFPAVAVGLTAVLAGLLARELGGGRAAQGLAALAVATCPVVLATGHLHSTTTYDLAFSTAIVLVVTRLLRTGRDSLWLGAGAIAAVGVQNKLSVVFLATALLAGLLIAERERLRSPWPWAAAGLLLVSLAPIVAWHARHDWAVFEMGDELRDENGGLGAALAFVPLQVALLGVLGAPLAIAGLVWLLRGRFRALGAAAIALAALFLLSSGKPYYAATVYPLLLAGGAVAVETGRVFRILTARRAAILAVAGGLIFAPFLLPLVPERSADRLADANEDAGSQIGWERVVAQIARARDTLPPGVRDDAAVVAANYGEAGAVDLFGAAHGLPPAHGTLNSYWWWGPPEDGRAVVMVGYEPQWLADVCEDARLALRLDPGVPTEEQGAPVSVCTRLRAPWSQLWPDLRHYG